VTATTTTRTRTIGSSIFSSIAKHDKPIKPSFLIEVMALECLDPPFNGCFDYEFQAAFSASADRILDIWDPNRRRLEQ
jgi:hypothetical protein